MDENEVKGVNQEENVNTNSVNEGKSLNICGLLSFIFSLLGLFVVAVPLGIAAVILGIIGIVKFNKEKQKYKWMGIVGLCVGTFDVVAGIINIVTSLAALTALF